MSNNIDNQNLDDATANLRTGPAGKNPFLKNPIMHVENKSQPLTTEAVLKIAEDLRKEMEQKIASASYNPAAQNQILRKAVVPITDFSKLKPEDVYDLSIPIEAKPFMSADVLAVMLKDSNYEARWVNKNSQNLGDKIAKGYTYVTPEDLLEGTQEAIKTSLDASGHYCFNDVVAMKIDKATYYRALRAAHERAVSTTNQTLSLQTARKQAHAFMQHESGFANDFNNAAEQGKLKFYDPGVGI